MKKALSVFLMLALVGSVFAAEPVAAVTLQYSGVWTLIPVKQGSKMPMKSI